MIDNYKKAVAWVNKPGGVLDSLKAALAPSTRGEEAGFAGRALVEDLAVLDRKRAIARAALEKASDYFDRWIVRANAWLPVAAHVVANVRWSTP